MKATVNGIVLEGTPEEILKYQKLVQEQSKVEQFDKFKGVSKGLDVDKLVKDIQSKLNKKPIIFGYY